MEVTANAGVHLGMSSMRESVTAQESWVYHCGHCLHVWHEDFEAHHTDDGHGGDAVSYYRQGERCLSPSCDRVCPNCGACSCRGRPAAATRPEPVPPPLVRPYDLELIFRMRKLHAY